MERNIMAYLQHQRGDTPTSRLGNQRMDCCTGHCLSCGGTYYGDSASRAEHKCPTCKKEKRPYNPDIAPLLSPEMESLK